LTGQDNRRERQKEEKHTERRQSLWRVGKGMVQEIGVNVFCVSIRKGRHIRRTCCQVPPIEAEQRDEWL